MKQELRAEMIEQGDGRITVPPGQIPVLTITAHHIDTAEWMEKLAIAIHFLSCGAPSVTIWSILLQDSSKQNRMEDLENLRRKLKDLLPEDPTRYEIHEVKPREGEPESNRGILCIQPRTIKYDLPPDPPQQTE